VRVDCGYFHTACINESGELYTWGRGDSGQLGHGNTKNELKPKEIPKKIFSEKVRSVSCGYRHTLACTDMGVAWTWGWNAYGQLGHGDYAEQLLPKKIDLGKRIVLDAACGQFHTAIVVDKGILMMCGKNNYGQLGIDSYEDKRSPTIVESLTNYQVVQVHCGGFHTAALVSIEKGDVSVFCWGRNSNGQLGCGDYEHRSSPVLIQSLHNKNIIKIRCGIDNTGAIANQGRR